MPSFDRSRTTLRIAGDLLMPDKVSQVLGSAPTGSWQKGDEILGRSGHVRVARTGMWWSNATSM